MILRAPALTLGLLAASVAFAEARYPASAVVANASLHPWHNNIHPTDIAKSHVEQIAPSGGATHKYTVLQSGTIDGRNCRSPMGCGISMEGAFLQSWESNRSVRMENVELLTTLRRREGASRWISAWRSRDNAKTWIQENDPVENLGEGNPPMLNRLHDGRLCLTYGFRAYPFSIRARLSTNNGKSWGPQIVLRQDGVDRDIGYVRSVQHPDGKMVTTYYISDRETGPERYIVATIWDPNLLQH